MTWTATAKWLWRKLIERAITPKGGVGTAIELGSGYSTEGDRMKKREQLEALQVSLMADPGLFQAEDGRTFCNMAAARLMVAFDYEPGDPPPLANTMIQRMLEDPGRWTMDDSERAVAHAMRGGLAFAVKKYPTHGHLASIAPREMEMSGSLGHKVPLVCNIGKGRSRLCKVSEAFPPSEGEPRYLLLDEEEFS